MTEKALKAELDKIVDISTYDPDVMEDRREKDQDEGKGSRSGSVHRVAFPLHKEGRWLGPGYDKKDVWQDNGFAPGITPYDPTDYFARLYPILSGGSDDFWQSVLKCFDLAST